MKRSVHLSLILLLAALLVSSAGCRKRFKPVRMNNMMARGNAQLAEAAKKFHTAVSPLGEGKPADAKAARDLHNEIKGILAQLHKDFDDAKPPNSPPGEDLLDKYRSFLMVQQDIFDECYTPILNAVENSSLSDGEKWEKVQPLISKAGSKESTLQKELVKQQDELAKRYNLDPK